MATIVQSEVPADTLGPDKERSIEGQRKYRVGGDTGRIIVWMELDQSGEESGMMVCGREAPAEICLKTSTGLGQESLGYGSSKVSVGGQILIRLKEEPVSLSEDTASDLGTTAVVELKRVGPDGGGP